MDHLFPRSRGGAHSWLNVVLMCPEHNNIKGDRTLGELGWTLKRKPTIPRYQSVHVDRADADPRWEQWLDVSA